MEKKTWKPNETVAYVVVEEAGKFSAVKTTYAGFVPYEAPDDKEVYERFFTKTDGEVIVVKEDEFAELVAVDKDGANKLAKALDEHWRTTHQVQLYETAEAGFYATQADEKLFKAYLGFAKTKHALNAMALALGHEGELTGSNSGRKVKIRLLREKLPVEDRDAALKKANKILVEMKKTGVASKFEEKLSSKKGVTIKPDVAKTKPEPPKAAEKKAKK